MLIVSLKRTDLLHITNVILQALLPTCAGGTGPVTWFAGPSVAVVVSPGVTGHLTLVCLKAGSEAKQGTRNFKVKPEHPAVKSPDIKKPHVFLCVDAVCIKTTCF